MTPKGKLFSGNGQSGELALSTQLLISVISLTYLISFIQHGRNAGSRHLDQEIKQAFKIVN
ncbi:MAG: hypothetical protein KDK08_01175 [Rhizobiaceae bacterium]|nr:hypothetical protein [Rhizobiaceae bacterium]